MNLIMDYELQSAFNKLLAKTINQIIQNENQLTVRADEQVPRIIEAVLSLPELQQTDEDSYTFRYEDKSYVFNTKQLEEIAEFEYWRRKVRKRAKLPLAQTLRYGFNSQKTLLEILMINKSALSRLIRDCSDDETDKALIKLLHSERNKTFEDTVDLLCLYILRDFKRRA